MKTLIANLQFAARNNETVNIGGGYFSPQEIKDALNQINGLLQERDDLRKQVKQYEKNGVTCQTYRNIVESSCSECNIQEKY